MNFLERVLYTADGRRNALKILLITIAAVILLSLMWRILLPDNVPIQPNTTARQIIESAVYDGIERIIAEGMAYGNLVSVTRDAAGNVTEIRSNRGLLNMLSSRLNEEIKENLLPVVKNKTIINVNSKFESHVSTSIEGITHRLVLEVNTIVGRTEVRVSIPLAETVYVKTTV